MPINLKALHGSLWLCEPERLLLSVERVRAFSACPTARELATYRRERLDRFKALAAEAEPTRWTDRTLEESFAADRMLAGDKAIRGVKGRIGVIPVHGPIQQRMTGELMKAGGTSTEEVGMALDTMLADKSIGGIVLHVDSPGGESYGVEELSDKIFNARGQKPIHAIADSMAASAGYWIATAAKTLSVTTGGDVGSVGVYALHFDESAALEQGGIKVTAIQAGKHKTDGAPWAPLSEDAIAHFQEQVNETMSSFVAALARNRGTEKDVVRRDFGEGRVVSAQKAVKTGMADRVLTFGELLAKLAGTPADSTQGRSASVFRLRHELAKARGW